MDPRERELIEKLLFFNVLKDKGPSFVDTFRNAQVPQKLLGITDEEMHYRYLIGHQLFDRKHFKEAEQVFSDLIRLNPLSKPSWLALAITQSRLNRQEEAVINFSLASLLDPNDPHPYYNAGLCYVVLEEDKEALLAFELAAQTAKTEGSYRSIEEQAGEWIQKLRGAA